MTVRPVGTRAILIEVPSTADVHRLWGAIREERPPGVEEAVAGARSVLVMLSEEADPAAVASALTPDRTAAPARAKRTIELPVAYDGPDLDTVAASAGVGRQEVAELHSTPTYTVGFLGFSPGFAYLFGGDPRLMVPRLESPRTAVPAGSVALAADMTAVYPQATPGGWQLIGRTDAAMFDPRRAEPALLAPGDLVRFIPAEDVGPPPVTGLRSTLRAAGGARDAVEVLAAGPLLTVQDGGRRGWAHAGVPVAGAADEGSARRANQLVGNRAGQAVLESTLGRCRLRLRTARMVAVTGAEAEITVDGLPARRNVGLPLPPGAELTIGACRVGVRVYVAVAGGIDVDEVLGSRATDTLSGLGPAPLREGDVLPLGAPVSGMPPSASSPAAPPLPRIGDVLTLTGRWGPRHDLLSAEGRRALATTEFTVRASSDRTGARLEGPPVDLAGAGEIPSEGMVAGAVQVPPSGQPIVLMRNHPPTGGYPVAAVVDDGVVDALAQAAPGQRVRFDLRP